MNCPNFCVLVSSMFLASAVTMPAAPIRFQREFAPQEGLVSRYENPWRQELCLNGSWRFQGDTNTSIPDSHFAPPTSWDATMIKIPSPWNINAFCMNLNEIGGDFRSYPSYPKDREKLRAAWMEKDVMVPKNWNGKRLILRFSAVAGKMAVFVNGRRAGEGFDIFFPQEFDVTDLIQPGATNHVLVKVVASKEFDKPGHYGRREYLSGSFWGTFISGIWQDVFLLAEPDVAFSDIFVQPCVNRDELRIQATVANHGKKEATVSVSGVVREWINETGNSVLETPEVKWRLGEKTILSLPDQKLTLQPGESQTILLTIKVNGSLKLWSPDSPNLCGLLLTISTDGKILDTKYQRFGWRQFTIDGNQFLLNGQPITLRGDSWHFMGVPQMTRRYAYAWYRLLKDAGANAVRLHASVYPSFYHDMADEMGIMILDESAIWASDGGPKADSDLFWQNCRDHVRKLVLRDRNHPSVFGWSICNEILPVLHNVWHAPQSMTDRCLAEMVAWRDICLTNDPTRSWISGDGEWDAQGRLPVINIHYGGPDKLQRAAASGKPWAVGETSMAYYGTPKQVSKFNGNRAYESDLGRMEGLAYECYGLLHDQQINGANYQSVFNLAWYSIQPLPLGKSDLTKEPSLDEGITFGPYREGVPGMQPERLGPYTSTLNPGYDPALPLYRPWPMFDAIRDANRQITNSPWAKQPPLASASTTAPQETNVIAYCLPGNGTHLAKKFAKAGIKLAAYSSGTNTQLLLLDASGLLPSLTKNAVDKVLTVGGTVWIWDVQPANTNILNQWFGADISVQPRSASSFVVARNDPLLAGIDNAGLYFSENDNWQQMEYSLAGTFVEQGKVLVKACPADWRRWNYKPEPVKTAALFRSEVEYPAADTTMVVHTVGKGRVILCNFNPDIQSDKKSVLIQQMFRNEGVQPADPTSNGGFIDSDGHLLRALVCGDFAVTNVHNTYTNLPAGKEITEKAIWDGKPWRLLRADYDGQLGFKTHTAPATIEKGCTYLAVWIKSPKPLNDLLSEPDLPKLSFNCTSNGGCQVWLNRQLLASHDQINSSLLIEPLLLKLGWNELVIKLVHGINGWKFAGQFTCSDSNFLSSLQFASEKPNEE